MSIDDYKLCDLFEHIPFLMDDSKRWKAYFYKSGDPCLYTDFAASEKVPDGDPLNYNRGMAGGNWAYYTVTNVCDTNNKEISEICSEKTTLNQGESITGNAQSSRLSLIGTNGSSTSKFLVEDIGLGGIQEWSLPKYIEPKKEKWGSVLGHQKMIPELTPPYVRGSRLGIRTAHIYVPEPPKLPCEGCLDFCCDCSLRCRKGGFPPLSYISGKQILRDPCEPSCTDPESAALGKPLGNEQHCYCVATNPVTNQDYITFLNYVAKNDIFGGNNSGYTSRTKDTSILDLWNIDMYPIIKREVFSDPIHKYFYHCDDIVSELPVVNVTFYGAIWFIKWMRSGFLNMFPYSQQSLDLDSSKQNCGDDCIDALIRAGYTWDYNPIMIY